jgi:hypothetical protein
MTDRIQYAALHYRIIGRGCLESPQIPERAIINRRGLKSPQIPARDIFNSVGRIPPRSVAVGSDAEGVE